MKLPLCRTRTKPFFSNILTISLGVRRGSHRIYRNDRGIRVTVPFHSGKTLHPKIIKSIIKDAEITESDF